MREINGKSCQKGMRGECPVAAEETPRLWFQEEKAFQRTFGMGDELISDISLEKRKSGLLSAFDPKGELSGGKTVFMYE